MKIRNVTKDDVEKIAEIYAAGLLDEYKIQFPELNEKEIFDESRISVWGVDDIEKTLDLDNYYTILAEESGIVVGFCSFRILKNGIGFIDRIYVSKNDRKKGAAKMLMDATLKMLEDKGLNRFRTNIFLNNEPSKKLFESFGFKPRHVTWELRK